MTQIPAFADPVKPKRARGKKSNINRRSRGELIALPGGAQLWTAPGYLARRPGTAFVDPRLLAECAGRA